MCILYMQTFDFSLLFKSVLLYSSLVSVVKQLHGYSCEAVAAGKVITWNDYSEGTMIEPSWVRPRDVCLSTCVEENIQPCLTSSACDSGFDPLDCTKPYDSFSGPVDPQQLGT